MINVTNTQILDRYVTGVTTRAAHHAPNVFEVIPALLGHALIYGKEIELYGDGTAIPSWFRSKRTNHRYAFNYHHATRMIDLHRGSIRGPVVASFENATSNTAIGQVFASL